MRRYTIALLFLLTVPNSSAALSCLERSIEETVQGASLVFQGTLTNIQEIPSEHENTGSSHLILGNGTLTFKVSRFWKGRPSETQIVEAPLSAWPNLTPYFSVGDEYLIFAYDQPGAPPSVALNCSYTGSVRGPADIPTELGDGTLIGNIPPVQDHEPVVFTRDLTVGVSGDDVAALQTILELRGFLVMPQGVVKGYFGERTRNALARYQVRGGITPAVGYFGPRTRAFVAQDQ